MTINIFQDETLKLLNNLQSQLFWRSMGTKKRLKPVLMP